MKRPNTLIIEDNLFLIKVIRNLLLYQTGVLKFAKTVEEAQELLKTEDFELILSDFHLGEENSLPILHSLSDNQSLVFMSSDFESLNLVKTLFSKNKGWAFVNKNEGDWLIQIQNSIHFLMGNFKFNKTA